MPTIRLANYDMNMLISSNLINQTQHYWPLISCFFLLNSAFTYVSLYYL